MLETIRPTSTAWRVGASLRLKARIWRTRSRARAAPPTTTSRSARSPASGGQVFQHAFGQAQHGHQRVVQVMGDSAGQRAQRLHLERLLKLPLQFEPLGLRPPHFGDVLQSADDGCHLGAEHHRFALAPAAPDLSVRTNYVDLDARRNRAGQCRIQERLEQGPGFPRNQRRDALQGEWNERGCAKISYIISDHTIRPERGSNSQLPTWATAWARIRCRSFRQRRWVESSSASTARSRRRICFSSSRVKATTPAAAAAQATK